MNKENVSKLKDIAIEMRHTALSYIDNFFKDMTEAEKEVFVYSLFNHGIK